MPIVVVHGVNVRENEPGFNVRRALMASLIREHFSGAAAVGKTITDSTPDFAYWGDLGAHFAWDMASLPTRQVDSLGVAPDSGLRAVLGTVYGHLGDGDLDAAAVAPLLTVAKRSLSQAVAMLSELLIQAAAAGDEEPVVAFISAAQAYAEANPNPAWMSGAATDAQLLSLLVQDIGGAVPAGVQSLGQVNRGGALVSTVGGRLRQAVSAAADTELARRTGDFACTRFLTWQRRQLNAAMGLFFGDVFVYLDGRGDASRPGAIPQRLIESLRAAAARAPAEPLIVIAHSLGGVIVFDLLSAFCSDIVVDVLVTVGSQVSHFEELKRLKSSAPSIPSAAQPHAPTPTNVIHWINAFDEVDVFAYACERVFDRVLDFHYDTGTHTIGAHSAYLEQHRFYRLLRKRIDKLS